MERYGRLTAILAVVLLHQFAISTSRAAPRLAGPDNSTAAASGFRRTASAAGW